MIETAGAKKHCGSYLYHVNAVGPKDAMLRRLFSIHRGLTKLPEFRSVVPGGAE
jgi:hypothetical protein